MIMKSGGHVDAIFCMCLVQHSLVTCLTADDDMEINSIKVMKIYQTADLDAGNCTSEQVNKPQSDVG